MSPIPNLESITSDELASLGFNDPECALRIIRSLPGLGVSDDVVNELLPSLLNGLKSSPDPDRALNNFERWTNAVTSRYTHFRLLIGYPATLDIFLNVCGNSQFFSDILVRNPEYIEVLANPAVRGVRRSAEGMHSELSSFVDAINRPELKFEAIRRFKQREILRIGANDILGLTGMPDTSREFSNLADACVQECLDIVRTQLEERYRRPAPAFAVIAMGKHGGQELNYSSDIDLIFVTADPETDHPNSTQESTTPERRMPEHPNAEHRNAEHPSQLEYAHKLAEGLVNSMSRNSENGHLFRVDLRLRPEGRFGALVRTVSSYKAYYESWAEPWELQALIKARFVAGDAQLGRKWLTMTLPYVYRRSVTPEFLDDIRHNKERIEQKADVKGVQNTNVKIGVGGIRDIEFTVQLLQLERGGRHPILRTANTLEALARLRQIGAISKDQAIELSEDYQFLRNVEHRLQILYDLQTQTLPSDERERNLVARRLGFPDTLSFDAEYVRRTVRVRRNFEYLFLSKTETQDATNHDEVRRLVENTGSPESDSRLEASLTQLGFGNSVRVRQAISAAVSGTNYGDIPPDARRLFVDLAGPFLSAALRTGDPDAAFLGIDILASEAPNRAEFYRALMEGEDLLDRLCRLAAGSPDLLGTLARHQEWLDLLVSDEILDPCAKPIEQHQSEIESRISLTQIGSTNPGNRQGDNPKSKIENPKSQIRNPKSEESFWRALASYIQRERLRIGARDLWGDIDSTIVGTELANLADSIIQTLLNYEIDRLAVAGLGPTTRAALSSVAIIGLGKLGGRDLGYGSDWDILLVTSDESMKNASLQTDAPIYPAINALAESLLSAGQELRTRGAPVELDARLRPEGRFGTLARTVSEYRDYYRETALTWEKQTLIKARCVAGNPETARAYLRAAHELLYRHPFTPEEQLEIVAMKRRIEDERLKLDERQSDLKLGHGGMSDIEFVAQLHQWRWGSKFPQVRTPNTVEALISLGSVGVIPGPDAYRLANAYSFLTALRNRLVLRGGISIDNLPHEPAELRATAISLGIMGSESETAESSLIREVQTVMHETRNIFERLFYRLPA